jgi:hypothetical protein
MLTSPKASPERTRLGWLGVVKMLVAQVGLLLTVSGAVIWYLNWSSEVSQAEFARVSKLIDQALPSQTTDDRRGNLEVAAGSTTSLSKSKCTSNGKKLSFD